MTHVAFSNLYLKLEGTWPGCCWNDTWFCHFLVLFQSDLIKWYNTVHQKCYTLERPVKHFAAWDQGSIKYIHPFISNVYVHIKCQYKTTFQSILLRFSSIHCNFLAECLKLSLYLRRGWKIAVMFLAPGLHTNFISPPSIKLSSAPPGTQETGLNPTCENRHSNL